jgi:transcriptional regulator with XRE-family HTH domain
MKVARTPAGGLIKARTAKGLTQVQLAKLLDVSPGTVGGWESGAHGIRSGRLKQVARVLGVEVAELVA